jgi:site-specific recombinase XerD
MPPTRRSHQTLAPGTLENHYQGFLTSLRRKRPETRGTYGRALREFLRWSLRRKFVARTPGEIERYKAHLEETKRLSPVSVSTYLTAVRRFYDYLKDRGLVSSNPAASVVGNSRPHNHTRGSLTSDEVTRLLSVVDPSTERGARDFVFISLMLDCGLSEIELIRADVRDYHQLDGRAVLEVQGKGRIRKDQRVDVTARLHAELQRYLAMREKPHPHAPLFPSAGNRTRGRRMTTRGVRDRIGMYLKRAGITGSQGARVTPFSLRHTAAFRMARSGASADEIRRRMRLGTLATAKLYLIATSPPSSSS